MAYHNHKTGPTFLLGLLPIAEVAVLGLFVYLAFENAIKDLFPFF